MPDITEENYALLLERIDKLETKTANLEAANKDLAAMNRALIGRTTDSSDVVVVDKKELGDRLLKGLKHAKLS